MKSILVAMSYILAFYIGWSIYNPIERNQPKSYAIKAGERLRKFRDAIDAYYVLNHEFPRSILELQQCNMYGQGDSHSFYDKNMTYEITNNCAVVRMVNPGLYAEKDFAAKGICLRQEVVLTISESEMVK